MRGTSGELIERKSAHLDKFAHLLDRWDGVMVELLSARLLTSGTWAQQTRRELEIAWLGPMKRSLSREPCLNLAKDFRACREPDTRSAGSKFGRRREPFGLRLRPWRGRWRLRWKWN